jgi:3-oxoacyl-[acyl-carrier protein] reductase
MSRKHEMKHYLIFGASSSIGIELINLLQTEGALITAQGNRFTSQIPSCKKILTHHFTQENYTEFSKQLEPDTSFDGLVFLLGKTDFTYFSNMSNNLWQTIIFENLSLPALLTKEFSKKLKNDASIVFISSAIADLGAEGMSHYAAAKAGLEGLTRSLAREFANRKIRVNCVSPHLIETRQTQSIPPKHKSGFINKSLLKRIGQPRDVASAINYLLSEDSSFLTGQILKLNGGSYFVN